MLCEERVKWSSSISRPSRRRRERERELMSRTRPRARSLPRAGIFSLALSCPIIDPSCSCSFPHSTPPQATSAAKCSQASCISQNETAYGVTAASLASFALSRAHSRPLYEDAGSDFLPRGRPLQEPHLRPGIRDPGSRDVDNVNPNAVVPSLSRRQHASIVRDRTVTMMKRRASTILPKKQQTTLKDRTPNTHTRPVVTARSSCGVADTSAS